MSITDDFRAIVARLRGWGFDVVEYSGCYGRSNGTGWSAGRPEGHINHHYVCSLNPEQGYIDSLVASLAGGAVVNWFADVNGRGYLLGTGPMNHSGTGNSSVLARVRADQPNYSVAGAAGDMTGNQALSGTEAQHPGDATPWPETLLEIVFAINAAEFIQWGYTANRAINHFAWTNRKIDMSWLGGVSSDANGKSLVDNVQQYMNGTGATPPPPIEQDEDMTPYTPDEMRDFAEYGARAFAATQEFRDRVMQACTEALSRNASAATAQAKTGSTQFGATQEFKDRVMYACQEAISRAGLT
jgi:hypothetical protein